MTQTQEQQAIARAMKHLVDAETEIAIFFLLDVERWAGAIGRQVSWGWDKGGGEVAYYHRVTRGELEAERRLRDRTASLLVFCLKELTRAYEEGGELDSSVPDALHGMESQLEGRLKQGAAEHVGRAIAVLEGGQR